MNIKINEEKLDEYIIDAKDAIFYTGLALFCSNKKDSPKYDEASFRCFTLLPSPFPKNEFEFAVNLQKHWNSLFHKYSNNPKLIYDGLKSVIEADEFMGRLWKICEAVHKEEIAQVNKPLTLNIMRVDYFLDENKKISQNKKTILSNIEINTLGVGSCAVPTKVHNLHKYILHKTDNDSLIPHLAHSSLYETLVDGLLKAWSLYNNSNAHILLVVRDIDFNFGDHRLIEHRIFELKPSIKFIRMTLTDIHKHGRLDDHKRLFISDQEIALVYFKSGFDPSNYPSENEWDARLMIERSKAIKAPKIEYQLMCAKKFQQYLYESGTIECFIQDNDIVDSIRATFVKQYSFAKGKDNAKLIEMCKQNPHKYVLKPQLEGGGHNLFGKELKDFVDNVKDESELYSFIMMDRIDPVKHFNYLIGPSNTRPRIQVDSEIGIYGISIGDFSSQELFVNEYVGYSLFTKDAKLDEWGSALGLGAYDSIIFT